MKLYVSAFFLSVSLLSLNANAMTAEEPAESSRIVTRTPIELPSEISMNNIRALQEQLKTHGTILTKTGEYQMDEDNTLAGLVDSYNNAMQTSPEALLDLKAVIVGADLHLSLSKLLIISNDMASSNCTQAVPNNTTGNRLRFFPLNGASSPTQHYDTPVYTAIFKNVSPEAE